MSNDTPTCGNCELFEEGQQGFGTCTFPLPHWISVNRHVHRDRGNCRTHVLKGAMETPGGGDPDHAAGK